MKEQCEAFMRDLFEATYRNPIGRGEVFNNEALIHAYPFDGTIYVSEIRAVKMRQGSGTRALKLLTSLADTHGVALTLTPKRVGNEGMSSALLRKWYQQHGFKNDRQGMKREPQAR